ncbi:MAG: glycosyltransferase [Thermodesulfobacteriota bacterium]
MDLTPIILFVYNRPKHTRQTVEALQRNALADESELFIFSDGPKTPEAEISVMAVRQYIHSIDGFKKIHLIERERNYGLANSIITGITEIVNQYGKVIILEDDIVTSPFFLRFMNEALHGYQNEEIIMQISGYMFPVALKRNEDTLLLPFTSIWGWATWQRAWKHFDPALSGHEKLKRSKQLQKKFNINNSYPFVRMLEAQLKGEINTWDIGWYLSVFLLNGLTLFPSISFTRNIGFDGSGVHCSQEDIFTSSVLASEYRGLQLIQDIRVDESSLQIISTYLKTKNPSPIKSYLNAIMSKLGILKKITAVRLTD